MSSYAARASRRSGATSTGESKTMQTGTSVSSSRPQLHSRKHSANSAGDVFAMLGQPIGSSKAASSGGGAGSTVGGKDKERDRSLSRPQHPSIKEEDSKGDTSDAIAGPLSSRKMLSESSKGAAASSSPSSSSPSTPATSLPTTGTTTGDLGNSRTGKRYDTYYSKPDLLKLWRSQLSVKADLEELYAAFEVSIRGRNFFSIFARKNCRSREGIASGAIYKWRHTCNLRPSQFCDTEIRFTDFSRVSRSASCSSDT